MIQSLVLVYAIVISIVCTYYFSKSIIEVEWALVSISAAIISSGVLLIVFGESFPISLFQIVLTVFIGLSSLKFFFFDQKLRSAGYYPSIIVFLVLISVSLFYSKGIEGGLINLLRFTVLSIFVFFIIQINASKKSLNVLMNVVISTAVFISIISILENILNPEIAIQNLLSSGLKIDRASAGGLYADPNRFAAALFLPMIYCFISVLEQKETKTKVLFSLILVVLIIGLVSSYSRSAFFSLGISLIFITIYLRKIPQLTVISLIGLVVITLIPSFRDSFLLYGGRILEVFSGNIDTSSNIRLMLGSGALAMFIDSNMLGVGFGAFSENFVQYFSTQESVGVVKPHNIFYTVLAELGVIGILIFLFILYKLFRDGIYLISNTSRDNKHLSLALVATLIAYLIFYQFYGGALYDANVYLTIGLILLMKLNLDTDRTKPSPNSIFLSQHRQL